MTSNRPHMNRVWQFFEPAGSPKLIFLHQVLEVENAAGDLQSEDDTPQLILTNGEVDRVHGGMPFTRSSDPNKTKLCNVVIGYSRFIYF